MCLRLLFLVFLIGGAGAAVEGKTRWQECLPDDVDAAEVVAVQPATGGKAARKITVTAKLKQLGARCRNKRLVDAKGKQVHFYRLTGCWGNPPENYQEILDNQNLELERLRRRYRVIEITCNPEGALIQ